MKKKTLSLISCGGFFFCFYVGISVYNRWKRVATKTIASQITLVITNRYSYKTTPLKVHLPDFEKEIRKINPSIKFKDAKPLDLWRKPISVQITLDQSTGLQMFSATSNGPDQISGTSDDIVYTLKIRSLPHPTDAD
jgi:hypothetical protein